MPIVIQLAMTDPNAVDRLVEVARSNSNAETAASPPTLAPKTPPANCRVFDVDASGWATRGDIYDAILPRLEAPPGYDGGINGLFEWMFWDERASVAPPYVIRLYGTAGLPPDVAEELGWIIEGVRESRDAEAERGRVVEAYIEVAVSDQTKRIIDIDASSWRCRGDLYDAILPRLGAPDWHGRNMNALTESIVWGEINSVEPPYVLRIRGTADLPPDVAEELGWLEGGVKDGRAEFNERWGYDVDVDVELLP